MAGNNAMSRKMLKQKDAETQGVEVRGAAELGNHSLWLCLLFVNLSYVLIGAGQVAYGRFISFISLT